MIKLPFYCVLLWLLLVNAQDKGDEAYGGSKEGIHMVDVGEDGELTFSPDTLKVAPGEKVAFQFYPGLHSVAPSTFGNPCHPVSSTSFYSGSQKGGEPPTVFTVTINDTKPIWFYCATPGHCERGMVGVINPPTNGSESLGAYKMAASKQSGSSAPAQVQGGIFGKASTSSSMASTSSTTPTIAASGSPSTTASPSSTPSTGIAAKSSIFADITVVSALALVMAAIVAQ